MKNAVLLSMLIVSLAGLALMAHYGREYRIMKEAKLALLPPAKSEQPGWKEPQPMLDHPINGERCTRGWVAKKRDNQEWRRICVDTDFSRRM